MCDIFIAFKKEQFRWPGTNVIEAIIRKHMPKP